MVTRDFQPSSGTACAPAWLTKINYEQNEDRQRYTIGSTDEQYIEGSNRGAFSVETKVNTLRNMHAERKSEETTGAGTNFTEQTRSRAYS